MSQREQVEIELLEKRVRDLAAAGGLDHGGLAGLADDDHSLYALADGSRGTFEVAGAVAAHAGAADPHPVYSTAAEVAAAITSHEGAVDPHPTYTTAAELAAHTTDLSYTAASRLLASSTGADVTLPLVASTDAGLAPASGGGTSNFLRADGTWAAPPGGSGPTRVVLGSDVTNNNAVANTIADVTGLSFPVTSGVRYTFRFVIRYTSAATTTGSRWSINGPATTELTYRSEYTLAATTITTNNATAYNIPAASNATSLTAGNIAVIEGIILPSANGTVIARFASEIANSAIVAKAGSYVEYAAL